MEAGSSSSPSSLGEKESIIVTIFIDDLFEGMVKMLSRSLVVTRALGDEMKRNSAAMVAKLKAELDKFYSSLKNQPWKPWAHWTRSFS